MEVFTALRKIMGDLFRRKPAQCPSCKGILKKTPQKKTKCPHCATYIFVRTRPENRKRVILTQADAEKIDEQWMMINSPEHYKMFTNERELLREKFGHEPALNDIKWGVLNKELMENAKNGDWGLYRNTRLDMADLLAKKMDLKTALRDYLEVCYIDLNGPTNSNSQKSPDLLKEYPAFDYHNLSFLAPAVIGYIVRIAEKLSINNEGTKIIFMKHNENVYHRLKLPLPPEECWDKIEKAIFTKQ